MDQSSADLLHSSNVQALKPTELEIVFADRSSQTDGFQDISLVPRVWMRPQFVQYWSSWLVSFFAPNRVARELGLILQEQMLARRRKMN